MYLLPIYLCLISFLISCFFGKVLSSKGCLFVNVLSIWLSLLISMFIFYEVGISHVRCELNLFPWFIIGNITLHWSFLFDALSATMLIVILFVSFCANFYSIEYMMFDPHKIRFFSYLSLFTFTMMMLVTSSNILQLFFGWESVGISSYLLINFWYTRIQANKSSILAILANKIGDILLLFCCLYLLLKYNSLYFNNISIISNMETDNQVLGNFYNLIINDTNINSLEYKNQIISWLSASERNIIMFLSSSMEMNTYFEITGIICFFIIMASICKSAQAGFHFWLAEAMEGPTPVSSLLHAATMVTAGIFLTVRTSYLFVDVSSNIIMFIVFIGSITGFFSSLIGVTQLDLKKIVAYSTCSQLGYMFLSNGIFAYNFTMFHLFNHAFFKALLFLTAGYIIHLLSNEQDLRKMGGLIKIVPLPYVCLCIGSLSLMGIPYLSGFFSKDSIIANFYSFFIANHWNIFFYSSINFSQILLSISILLTIFYSVKVLYYVFLNTFNGYRSYVDHVHFSGYFMIIPLILLSFLSITSGYLFSDLMIGPGSTFWMNSISTKAFFFDHLTSLQIQSHYCLLPFEFTKYTYYFVFFYSIYLSTIFFLIYNTKLYYIYYYSLGILKNTSIYLLHVNRKILFFNRLVINNILFIFFIESYERTYKLLDKNVFEILGPFGIVYTLKCFFIPLKTLSTKLIYHYLGIILLLLLYFIFQVLFIF